MKKMCTAGIALLASLTATQAFAQLGYNGGSYSQDFNSLSSSGAVNAWADNSTLAGWYGWSSNLNSGSNTLRDSTPNWATKTNYIADTGTSTTGSLFSYGSTGSGERALGSIGSNGAGDFLIGLVLQNTSSTTYTEFTLNYTGEQWRDGNNTDVAGTHILEFDYKQAASFAVATELNGSNVGGYTSVPALTFQNPISTQTAGALNGNLPVNQQARGATITGLSWAPGQFLVMRWWDNNNPGNDHGLSIDNLTFSAAPEPGTLALAAFGAMAMIRRRNRK